jgi:hypothetical protein
MRIGLRWALRAALFGALLAAGCAADPPYVPSPMTGEPTPSHPPEEAWARVLKTAVDEQGRVDFPALRQNHRDLDRYVAWIYQRSPASWPDLYPTRGHVIAYHLNAYNALALYNLSNAELPQELSARDRQELFERRKLFVGNLPLSLHEYRERLIRPLGEPRMHFALTRQVGGDPRLAREPYRASMLEAQLDRAARAFLGDARNVRVDADRRTVTLSPLLQAYEKDFAAGMPSLTAYVNRYSETIVPAGFAVEFAEHDWTVRGKR